MTSTTLTQLQDDQNKSLGMSITGVQHAIDTLRHFEYIQRAGKLFASSTLVPKDYQNNMANCAIAIDIAKELGLNTLIVMQNLYIVNGRPAWSSQFLIAAFNNSKRFSTIDYEFFGEQDNYGYRAFAYELKTGKEIKGTAITIGLAKKEGWYDKDRSKWKTMPEQMLRYRAASWLIRAYASEITFGFHTVDEIEGLANRSGAYRRL